MKFKSKSLIILFSIVCYWFYLNVCFGFFLSKIFYNFFDEINKASLSKIIEFRKKFNFDNIKKSVFRYILKIGLNALVRNVCCYLRQSIK